MNLNRHYQMKNHHHYLTVVPSSVDEKPLPLSLDDEPPLSDEELPLLSLDEEPPLSDDDELPPLSTVV